MLVFVLFTIWALGFFVLFTDPRHTAIRWASATAFVGGGGFLSGVIDEYVLVIWADTFAQHPDWLQTLTFLSRLASFVCQVGLPYTFLMFAVHSSDSLSRKVKRITQYFALIPPLIMLVITPLYPVLSFNYWIMVAWVIPYFLAACSILIILYRQEKDPLVKKNRFYTNLLIIVPLFFVFTFIYVMRIQNDYEAWRYNTFVVAIQFIFIVAVSLKYGFLGVRLRVEKKRLDSTLRAMTSGAQIVNHTIKNEVGKIALYADRMHTYAVNTNQPDLKEDTQVLIESSQHILNMVGRIQEQLREVVLREDRVFPSQIITQVMHTLQPYTEKNRIEVSLELQEEVQLVCDPVQLREVLANLGMNAIEAMKAGGTLQVQMFLSKKHLVIAITDTGTGISKENLPHVLDPFFSTKRTGHNFGLGLSYCYHVMQKHQGLLELSSEPGKGTTVFLLFPKKRIVHE
ncbi:sensor histidine kinase [Brevibacillus invocatus]|uniref:sensor histidine kinase n=1 Tax=Brevibacillus invocatus TaxID=173959 RepID=UPI00204040E2|nr:HAMP domain-containing sensor histidine kinase [Brevibacillus invocatus]MCM3077663.1 HAMP domain-containing histidine kinase [Brevibacillus invocatus]MCM3428665.1 HAMP domain-containing histidine kinase [Brevibacillus invocatus]